ncbi:MAG: thiol-disulfide oxidoreductase DCC family protein [Planctomycetota bacterium]
MTAQSPARRPPVRVVAARPQHDTVLYDGQCRFCRSQIAILRRLDPTGRLRFVSLHDPAAVEQFPELAPDDLSREMHVVDTRGRSRAGAEAVRYLSRRLPLLWPLAVPLHLPGSLPVWRWLYGVVARSRYRIAGRCDEGTCRVP